MAVSACFFLNGAVFGTWVTRIPAVSDRTSASPGALGLALLCIAVGSIAAMPLAGRIADRRGSARLRAFLDHLAACFAPLPPWEGGTGVVRPTARPEGPGA